MVLSFKINQSRIVPGSLGEGIVAQYSTTLLNNIHKLKRENM